MPPATPASIALPPASRISKPDLRGEVVGGCSHVPRADDARMVGGHAMLVSHPQSPFCGWTSAATRALLG